MCLILKLTSEVVVAHIRICKLFRTRIRRNGALSKERFNLFSHQVHECRCWVDKWTGVQCGDDEKENAEATSYTIVVNSHNSERGLTHSRLNSKIEKCPVRTTNQRLYLSRRKSSTLFNNRSCSSKRRIMSFLKEKNVKK